jgi:hypothetical protein
MPRLKARPETAQMEVEAFGLKAQCPASDAVPLKAASEDMIAHQSPALALQASLEQSWKTTQALDAVPVAKFPFGWTLIGMSVVCAVFWYILLRLAF